MNRQETHTMEAAASVVTMAAQILRNLDFLEADKPEEWGKYIKPYRDKCFSIVTDCNRLLQELNRAITG